ncbi:MAG: acyl-CoA thioesterase [Candidatus Liberibacter ctenarytainae]|uniref:Acyl-CoA thioesterase n=1 Tax=Candidatus Liberibacter ctenarytainae TaxID=2020335 RepID=A0A937AJR0_9HYPH|nr:acyl-CoA thioesterase [Candidatus Liberibacter ctenarytainae]
MTNNSHSSGELTLKVQTMPTDVNLEGNIFGGWIMSQMDIACSIRANQECKCRIVTKAVKELLFEHPIKLGDLVHIYTQVHAIGKTSITIYCDVWTCSRHMPDSLQKVSEATMVMVAIDDQGKPKRIYK